MNDLELKHYYVQSPKGICNNVLLTTAALCNAYQYQAIHPTLSQRQLQSGSQVSLYSILYYCLNPVYCMATYRHNSIVATVDMFCTVRGSTLTRLLVSDYFILKMCLTHYLTLK